MRALPWRWSASRLGAIVSLCTSGLGAGVLTGTKLGGFPLLASLPEREYVNAHAFLSTRYDPFMPICLVTSALINGIRAGHESGLRRQTLGAASALAAATAAISLTVNVPINRRVRDIDPEASTELVLIRDRWGRANEVRTACAVVSFVLTCCGSAAKSTTGKTGESGVY